MSVRDESKLPAAEDLIRWLVSYIGNDETKLNAGETLQYGFWLLRFEQGKSMLNLWERSADGSDWIEGADFTLHCWTTQHAACEIARAPFAPPRSDHLAAVSDGVMEGERVEAARDIESEGQSGWCLWTHRWNHDPFSLAFQHLFHVVEARPDLIPYLALPPGYAFRQTDGPTIVGPDLSAETPDSPE
ncbi:MAG TPA: hypothetical protein VGR41_07320 [Actinomycetota bacterium]|nr:hypothetical protein [Actinomycetota bacterium]